MHAPVPDTSRTSRVLVADDSPTIRTLLRLELEDAGYEVCEAGDGEQALHLLLSQDVDVILLDVEMPVMDGYETLRRLKAEPALRDVPVVFLTGRGASSELAEALHLGAHDYLRKPPEPVELVARVAAASRVKALQDQLRHRAVEMEQMSRTDYLTGLFNRRHMEEHLHAAAARAQRSGKACAAVIVDVDHFKRVNDTLGHEAGDEVLRQVSQRLAGSVREEDELGRWGGEEFLLVVSDTTLADIEVLAERLRQSMHVTGPGAQALPCPISVSIGCAVGAHASVTDLLRRADEHLYSAKESGRDRWEASAL